jgi:hypothetical protein
MKVKFFVSTSLFLILGYSCANEDKAEPSLDLVSEEINTDKEETQVVKVDDYPEYTELKNTSEYFGQWSITNKLTHSAYFYEIYIKDGEYTGVARFVEYKYEKLVKDGIKYIVQDNEYGEYYTIDANMNMTLFDKDGQLTSSGYIAVYNPEKM